MELRLATSIYSDCISILPHKFGTAESVTFRVLRFASLRFASLAFCVCLSVAGLCVAWLLRHRSIVPFHSRANAIVHASDSLTTHAAQYDQRYDTRRAGHTRQRYDEATIADR